MPAHQQSSEHEEQSRWQQAAFVNLHPVPTPNAHDGGHNHNTVRPHQYHALERTDAITNQRRNHTALGFALGVSALALLLLLLNLLDISPYIRTPERKTIPIQLLQLGLPGTTTGSSGNMTEEGSAARGTPSTEPLADASPNSADKAAQQAVQQAQQALQALTKATAKSQEELAKAQPTQEFANQAFPKPVETVKTAPTSPVLSSPQQPAAKLLANAKEPTQPTAVSDAVAHNAAGSANGSANKAKPSADASSVGTAEGDDASGLGRFGTGSGKGTGYGLEWGGGGNRVVLHKEMPKYPSGVNTSVQIKIRFTVLPNGSVGAMLPMQKGDPVLERAAIEALRRWQFNPLNDTKDMVGFITFTFRVQ